MPPSDWFGGASDPVEQWMQQIRNSGLPDIVIQSILNQPSISDSDVRIPHPQAVDDAFLQELLGVWGQQQRDDPMRAVMLGRQLFGQGVQSDAGDMSQQLGRLLFPTRRP